MCSRGITATATGTECLRCLVCYAILPLYARIDAGRLRFNLLLCRLRRFQLRIFAAQFATCTCMDGHIGWLVHLFCCFVIWALQGHFHLDRIFLELFFLNLFLFKATAWRKEMDIVIKVHFELFAIRIYMPFRSSLCYYSFLLLPCVHFL